MISLLECRAVSCGYHGKTVLSNVELEVGPGDAVALLGPNGSGKSTLLRTITREIPTIAGIVSLGGQSVASLSAREIAQRVAVVPQAESSQFAFTVRDAVTLGRLAKSRGLFDTAEDAEAATEAMRMADCLHLESRSITELSGGEAQRVLIARALAQDSPLVLLDEPTAHLDPLHQIEVVQLVKDLATHGKGVLTAIHDLNLASELAETAVLLGDSGVLVVGPIQEVLRSQALEEAYRVQFDRLETGDGRVFVRPLAPI